jgi:hypothetical protein
MQDLLSAIICNSNGDWQWSWFTSLPFWRGITLGTATTTMTAATLYIVVIATAAAMGCCICRVN